MEPPVATKPSGFAVGFCGDRRPSCHVFHTSRQAMIKTYNIALGIAITVKKSNSTKWNRCSLNIPSVVMQISGLTKCWFWWEFSWEVTGVTKSFPFYILIDILTSDTIYRSNLKYRFSICIAYRYAVLQNAHVWLKLLHFIWLSSKIDCKTWYGYPWIEARSVV